MTIRNSAVSRSVQLPRQKRDGLQPRVDRMGQQERRHGQVGHVDGLIDQRADQLQPAVLFRLVQFRVGHAGAHA